MTSLLADYARRCTEPSDIYELLPTLYHYATGCDTIAEFGTRTGNSTVALLAGMAQREGGGVLYSYDINDCSTILNAVDISPCRWVFSQQDTTQPFTMPTADGLMIDSLHTAAQVRAELVHAMNVRSWIVFHDVVTFAAADEDTGQPPGINAAIFEFLSDHPEWQVVEYHSNCNGLLVLARR